MPTEVSPSPPPGVQVSAPSRFPLAWMLGADLTAMAASLGLAVAAVPWYRPFLGLGSALPVEPEVILQMTAIVIPLWLLCMSACGLYSSAPPEVEGLSWRLLKVQVWGLGSLAVVLFFLRLASTSRLVVLGYAIGFVPLDMMLRYGIAEGLERHRRHIYSITRVVVVGAGPPAQVFIRQLQAASDRYFEILGYVDAGSSASDPGTVPLRLGDLGELKNFLFSQAVDVLAFAVPPASVAGGEEAMQAALDLGLEVAVVPNFHLEQLPELLPRHFDEMAGFPVLRLRGVHQSPGYMLAKRATDIVVSATLLLMTLPLLAGIAASIKLSSPRDPVFFHWRVLGRNRKPVHSFKFRTMVRDAEMQKAELLQQNEMTGPVFKIRHDPRVTHLGRWLRKFSLDELPQLYSVLKGDLSLVGPRPPSQSEADRFEFWQRRKLSVKPGLTCLWQVSGRNNIRDFSDWVRLDLEYISRASYWLDLRILVRTIPAVLFGRGAF